jgi:hypothetical protein
MERTLLVIVILLLALAMLTFLPVPKHWRSPEPQHAATQSGRTPKDEDVKVWMNTRSGLYYCRGSKMYGKLDPGSYERQGEALRRGYRPYSRQACPSD